MSNSRINLLANVVLPLFVIALTTTLFFMFRPLETTALFYINLGYVIFLEAVFFGYMNFVFRKKTESLSTPFYAIFGIYSFYYVLIGIIWLVLFSLAIVHFAPLKVYIAGIILLTLVWIILSLLIAQADTNYKQSTDQMADQRQCCDLYIQKMNMLYSNFSQAYRAKAIENEDMIAAVGRFKLKFATLPPCTFSNAASVSQMNSIQGKFEHLIEQLEDASEDHIEGINKKIIRFAESSCAELDMIKNMTRK